MLDVSVRTEDVREPVRGQGIIENGAILRNAEESQLGTDWETSWVQMSRLRRLSPWRAPGPGREEDTPLPPYLFAGSEANRSFRINKCHGENGQKQSQPKPTKATERVYKPFRISRRLNSHAEQSQSEANRSHRAKPTLLRPWTGILDACHLL